MERNPKEGKARWARLIPAALILALTACDGVNKGASSGGGKPQTGPTAGILPDTAGVAYLASSGAAGTTDEKGVYKYNHGDTVEFKLGSLIIGKVKGTPVITPIELAGDSSARLQNLLILLQSLDVDGNLENGISIPANAAASLSASINLDSDPAAFVASPELRKAREDGGIAGAVKTAKQANNHFLSQGINRLSTNIWVGYDDAWASVIRISAAGDGEYLQAEATPDDSCDANRVCGGNLVSKAGVEYGAASISEFDTRGFKFVGMPAIDTNLQGGLSHPRPTWRVRTDGSELITSDIVTVPRERKQKSLFGELFHIAGTLEISSSKEPIKTEVKESRFARMENDPKGIVGAWVPDTTTIKTPTYFFFSNGKFLMADPIGDPERAGHESCGGPGIEFASYNYDAAGNALTVKGFTYDTNGCAGFSGSEASSFKLGADGNTATLETKNGPVLTLHRISKGG